MSYRLPKEEIDMRTLVLSEARTFRDAAEKLGELGYPVLRRTLQKWAEGNPRYVPPATIDRLRVYKKRRVVAAKRPQPEERKPSAVVVTQDGPEKPKNLKEFGQAVVDAMVVMKQRIKELEFQAADRNRVISELQLEVAGYKSWQAGQVNALEREVERLQGELAALKSDDGFAETLADLVKV